VSPFAHWCRSTCGAASGPSEALTLLTVGAVYWLEIHPQLRRELVEWECRARAIPDDALREDALGKLTDERLNPEAAALFAVLAPRSRRRRVVSLIVAYQVLYDFLDAVNERTECAELSNGLQLHRALAEALLPDRPLSDYYRYQDNENDGGYARALVETCRRVVRTLPSVSRSRQVLARATVRCGEAQSHNHAIATAGESQLREWSLAQASEGGGYLWWELAAAGISCLGIHALVACGADPASTPSDAASVDAAYFPAICSLSALLDSLADYDSDAGTSNHSFIAHYADGRHAAERLIAIATDAAKGISHLRQHRRHRVILAGIVSYYLSCASVQEGFPALAAESLMRSAGSVAIPMRAVMRARRHLHAVRLTRGRASRAARGPASTRAAGPAAAAPSTRAAPAEGARAARRRRWRPRSRASARGPSRTGPGSRSRVAGSDR
jgi:tetraprenyl-beta-curcumene synthase